LGSCSDASKLVKSKTAHNTAIISNDFASNI